MAAPSRWFFDGRGLGARRSGMPHDRRIGKLVGYGDAGECFPGADPSGGVSYLLWERDYDGDRTVVNMRNGKGSERQRDPDRYDILIRSNDAVSIADKVSTRADRYLSSPVGSQRPFGQRTLVRPPKPKDLTLRWRNGKGPIRSSKIAAGREWVGKWKVIVSRVVYEHAGGTDAHGMRRVLSILEVPGPKEVCTETHVVVKAFDSEREAAVHKTEAYFRSIESGSGPRTPKFLWNAKMRFGKAFAAYKLAKNMGLKRVLVLTFKPAVQAAGRRI